MGKGRKWRWKGRSARGGSGRRTSVAAWQRRRLASTPMSSVTRVFDGRCARARVHLLCCRSASDVLQIDAPCSGVEELVQGH